MKYIFFSLAMLVATSTHLFSQSNDELALRQTLETYQAAMRNNDADAARPLLTENFLMAAAPGTQRLNKVQRLESIKSGQFKYNSFKNEDVKVTISEKVAYVIIKTTVKFKINEKDYAVNSVNLLFVKKAEDWQLADECYVGENCYR